MQMACVVVTSVDPTPIFQTIHIVMVICRI